MVKVIINNSYSRIVGLTPEQQKELRNKLSYASGSFFSHYGARRVSLLGAKGDFPTGLLSLVGEFLWDLNVPIEDTDNRIPPKTKLDIKIDLGTTVPYEAQKTAVARAVQNQRGIIAMPTGSGKSLVIALIASRLGVKTLVVVPSLEIKKQLLEAFKSIFGHHGWLTVENIDSTTLKTAKGYDCLIIDEAHHSAAKTYRKLNKTVWNGIYHRFFLTATPYRNDPEEELLFKSIAGDIIYQLTYKEAISKGYIVPVEAYYIEIPKVKTEAFTYAEVYSELVVRNEDRNKIIATLMQQLKTNNIATLTLVREIAHGIELSRLTGVDFVNGQDDDSREYIRHFNSGGIKAIIGTTGVLGEGVDTKPCEYVIIAGLGKAKSQFMQQVGRAVRKYAGKESAKVIIFSDKSHKFTKRHFKEQCKILLDEFGVKPIKLNIEP